MPSLPVQKARRHWIVAAVFCRHAQRQQGNFGSEQRVFRPSIYENMLGVKSSAQDRRRALARGRLVGHREPRTASETSIIPCHPSGGPVMQEAETTSIC